MPKSILKVGNVSIYMDDIDDAIVEDMLADNRLLDGEVEEIEEMCKDHDLFYNVYGNVVNISGDIDDVLGGNYEE